MCNELLKNAFRFHFCDICGSFYTLPCDSAPCFFNLRTKIVLKRMRQSKIIRCLVIPAHSNFPFAYNSILKGTSCAMNYLKIHFVSIFAASVEVFIRCAVILAHSNFPFAYNSILKGTRCATNCLKCISFPFLRHLQKSLYAAP